MKRTYLNAVPATFALYEGHAVAEARGHSYITDNDRQMGVAYLLCLMAVAFRAYERLDWERRSIFEEYAREFKESLQQDGFVYHHEAMYETATGDRIISVLLDGNPPRAVVPAKPQQAVPEPPAITAPADDLVEETLARTRKQRLVDAAGEAKIVHHRHSALSERQRRNCDYTAGFDDDRSQIGREGNN